MGEPKKYRLAKGDHEFFMLDGFPLSKKTQDRIAAARKRFAIPEVAAQDPLVDPARVHVERRYDEPSSTVTMFCGVIANLLDDGSIEPPEVDFFTENWAAKGTCPDCRAAHRASKS